MAEDKTEKKGEYTRQFYRVEYPEADRPVLKAGSRRYSVVNISEKGGRFKPEKGGVPDPGAPVTGTITFHDGEAVDVVGEVYKILDGDAVICFTEYIHFKRVLKEQWFLMQKYRHLVD